MDEQAMMRTYGNRDLHESTPDRPVVTLALFAFNQEKYVREAVEGAFSQTYSPLEIILSDDCSSDRTFEVMEEMAKAYRGPHLVNVRRNNFNIGTALHVQTAFVCSTGSLFIVAAGDDVSLPERTETLVSKWIEEHCPDCLIHSGRMTFSHDEPHKRTYVPASPRGEGESVLQHFSVSYWLPAAAPTCAYTRSVFERFPPLLGGSIIEDAPLFLRAALIGKYLKCDQALVLQRISEDQAGAGYRLSRPDRWNRFIQSKQIAFRNMQVDLRHFNPQSGNAMLDKVEGKVLEVLHDSSKLFVPERKLPSTFEKFILASRFLRNKAISNTMSGRIKVTLTFFELDGLVSVIHRIRKLAGIA
jgi:hypothetical protein